MRIAVGLSGGVDSAVTASLLNDQGHDVFGVTMAIWDQSVHSTGATGKHACFGPEEQQDIKEAETLCKSLGIPFQVYDCSAAYKKHILAYFRREYLAGRTPNPCIQCNQQIKLDVLPSMILEAGERFDKFATGHYARVEFDVKSERYLLKKAADTAKDQTYFLYRLTQQQLQKLHLPLGPFTKTEVRDWARKKGIAVSDKQDSQDFYSGNYNDLIDIREKTGNIVHINGQVLGKHPGIWNFTVGQRKGLGVSWHEPLYVIRLDAHTNQVIVGPSSLIYNHAFFVDQLNWIAFDELTSPLDVTARIRSSQTEFTAVIEPHSMDAISVHADQPVHAITPGQSAVFYQGEIVMGGGIINRVIE